MENRWKKEQKGHFIHQKIMQKMERETVGICPNAKLNGQIQTFNL